MKKILLFLFALIFSFSSFSQEKLGIANSNCYPVSSIFLNPSTSADSRAFIQFNLIGLNAYLFTNQAYLPKFSLWQLAKGNIEIPQITTFRMKKFFNAKFLVDAPIFTLSYRNFGAGFFVRGRAEGDLRNIPYEISKILLQPQIDTSVKSFDVNIRNLKLSEMSWVEYGINFGYMFRKRDNRLTLLGGNAKYLTGINIMYANLERLKAHADTSLLDIKKLKGKIRYNTPQWKAGKGIAFDLGFTFKKTLQWLDGYFANSKISGCKYIDYKYKFGLSLLDLGFIRFNNETMKGNIEGSLYIDNYQNVSSIDSAIQKNFKMSMKKNEPVWAVLPTALCAQGDYNLTHHFYVSGVFIKNLIPTRMVGVQRENLWSVAPRFEHRQVEVSMPLTFHRFIYPQLGFAFRLRTFVLGFDNVFPFLMKKNTYGFSAYFNLGISVFKNPTCKKKKPKKMEMKKYPSKDFTKPEEKPSDEEGTETPSNEEIEKNKKADDCPDLTGPYMTKPTEDKKKRIRDFFKKKEEK